MKHKCSCWHCDAWHNTPNDSPLLAAPQPALGPHTMATLVLLATWPAAAANAPPPRARRTAPPRAPAALKGLKQIAGSVVAVTRAAIVGRLALNDELGLLFTRRLLRRRHAHLQRARVASAQATNFAGTGLVTGRCALSMIRTPSDRAKIRRAWWTSIQDMAARLRPQPPRCGV